MPISSIPASTTGTVTSVGLVLPTTIFDVTVSPVTNSGNLTATLDTQAANTVFAGPVSGGAATPAFRVIGTADLGTGTANSGTYLRGDQAWAAVAAGGNVNGYGAVASLPATCAAGDTYTPSDRMWTYFATATNTWQARFGGIVITPPVAADFTYQVNAATTSTKADGYTGVLWSKGYQNGYMRATHVTAPPAAPYTVETGFIFNGPITTGYGIMLWENNATPANAKYEAFYAAQSPTATNTPGMEFSKYTGGTFTAEYTLGKVTGLAPQQVIWLRVNVGTVTTTGYISMDGINYLECSNHAVTGFLSAVNQIGWFAYQEGTGNGSGQAYSSMFHWKVF